MDSSAYGLIQKVVNPVRNVVGRRSRQAPARRVGLTLVTAVFGAAAVLSACGEAAPTGSSLCPVDQLTVPGDAQAEVTGLLDLTGSFDNTSEGFLRQVDAIVTTAVDKDAALRIMTFSGSSTGVKTLILCPSTVPDVNNDAVLDQRRTEIGEILTAGVRKTVAAAPPGEGGSDIWGAWAAYADAEVLADDRFAIMLTDGQQTFHSRPRMDLSGVTTEMWNIGRLRDGGTVPSEQAAKWIDDWTGVLTAASARDVRVTTGEYQGVG